MAALDELPAQMAQSDRRAKRFERAVVDLVEALVLQGREGRTFAGTIIDLDERRRDRGVASIPRLAVEAPVAGAGLELGVEQILRLQRADVRTGKVLFVPA